MIPREALTATIASVGLVLAHSGPVQAELAAPTGPVVLTVVGDIESTNRGPMDPAVDRLMSYYDQDFEAAAAFDLAMLEALGTESWRFSIEDIPEVQEIEGPTLAALFEAVGAEPDFVTLLAIDGYGIELDADMLGANDWLVSLKRNGRYLGIGDFGPALVVGAAEMAEGRTLTAEEAEAWPYQVFLIRVDGQAAEANP